MKHLERDKLLIVLCRVLVCCTFLGRAWQHLRWDAPVRALLWKQELMEPLISGIFGIAWRDWVTRLSVDSGIQGSVRVMGVIYLLCAVAALTVRAGNKIGEAVLALGSALLFVLSCLYFIDQYYRWGQLMEYTLQWSGPIFLLAALHGGLRKPRFIFLLKVATALTFIGHGLYAAGIYPMPGHFVTMVMNGLGTSEDAARMLLVFAGYADFMIAICLFVPYLQRPAIGYAVFWGFATAAARMVSHFDGGAVAVWLDSWTYQTVYRLIHGGLPLVLWFLATAREERVSAEPHTAMGPMVHANG